MTGGSPLPETEPDTEAERREHEAGLFYVEGAPAPRHEPGAEERHAQTDARVNVDHTTQRDRIAAAANRRDPGKVPAAGSREASPAQVHHASLHATAQLDPVHPMVRRSASFDIARFEDRGDLSTIAEGERGRGPGTNPDAGVQVRPASEDRHFASERWVGPDAGRTNAISFQPNVCGVANLPPRV